MGGGGEWAEVQPCPGIESEYSIPESGGKECSFEEYHRRYFVLGAYLWHDVAMPETAVSRISMYILYCIIYRTS